MNTAYINSVTRLVKASTKILTLNRTIGTSYVDFEEAEKELDNSLYELGIEALKCLTEDQTLMNG